VSSAAETARLAKSGARFPIYGSIGAGLVILFWIANWALNGLRTHWAFFPMWLGYCLAVDAIVRWRTGTSLLARSPRRYVGLFLISAPVWWLFEAMNLRTQNWVYLGVDHFSAVQYALWTTLSFTTVVPAVFGSAELVASFRFLDRLRPGLVIRPDRRTTLGFFIAGWLTLALMLLWPRIFFPFAWISPYFILEPLNVWLGNRTLASSTARGDWRPVLTLWLGVLITAFFWEMWNYFSFPKWTYSVPWGNWFHIFEMPLLGYGGYLPFSLEIFAMYHFAAGLLGQSAPGYVRLAAEPS
jgi:hypothetical protein